MIDTNSFLYNISGGLLFDKMPDINKLENCINVIINRHEALRTSFTIVNEEIVQKIENSIKFNLIVERQSYNVLPASRGICKKIFQF